MKTCNVSKCIDVVIFGKGIGESILIKDEDDYLYVVDSFLDDKEDVDKPIVLSYLEEQNICNPKIKGIFVTHWHKDHIEGICKILNKAEKDVKIVINGIMKKEQYREYLASKEEGENDESNVFFQFMDLVKERNLSLCPALAQTMLFKKNNLEIWALSPKGENLMKYIELLNGEENGLTRKNIDDNSLSIVLKLKIYDKMFILGGDLENKKMFGLKEIAEEEMNHNTNAGYFKIPHHGSKNGFCKELWEHNVVSEPYSFITRNNSSHLPQNDMVEEIQKKSKTVYIIGEEKNYTTIKYSDNPTLKKRDIDRLKDESSEGWVKITFNQNGKEIITCHGKCQKIEKTAF